VDEYVKRARKKSRFLIRFVCKNYLIDRDLDLIVWRPIFSRSTLQTLFTPNDKQLDMSIGSGLAGSVAVNREPVYEYIHKKQELVKHPKTVSEMGWKYVSMNPVIDADQLLGVFGIYSKSDFALPSDIFEAVREHIQSALFLVDQSINFYTRDKALENSVLALEAGKAAEDRFHDIKEVVFAINGIAGTLKRERLNHPAVVKNANNILTQLKKIDQYAATYLQEARNPNELKKRTFDYGAFVKKICREFISRNKHRVNGGRKIDIHFKLPEDEVTVYADIERISRAINNILTNAEYWVVKALNDTSRVDIWLEVDELFATLIVRDTGPGMIEPSRAIDKGYSDRGGTGLGLSIAARIFELHEGSLEITSEPTSWTKIETTIPLKI